MLHVTGLDFNSSRPQHTDSLIVYPPVIIIDALAERKNEGPASTILSVLGQIPFEIPQHWSS